MNRLYDITWIGAVYAVYEKHNMYQTRLYKYNLFENFKVLIPYNLICKTKFNDSSILITIISCDYLYLSLANEYVGDVTIPSHVIEGVWDVSVLPSYHFNLLCSSSPPRIPKWRVFKYHIVFNRIDGVFLPSNSLSKSVLISVSVNGSVRFGVHQQNIRR